MAALEGNWLFVLLLLGDMILTSSLELIAAVSPPEYDATVVNLIVFVFVGFGFAFLPGCIYLVTEWRYCCHDDKQNDKPDNANSYERVHRPSSAPPSFTTFHQKQNDKSNFVKCWKIVEAVLCAVFGPLFYYYGDNITKVVDTVSTSNITGNNTLACSDDCQSIVRASAVAALFAFILISNIDWQPNRSSTSKYLWGPVVDMLLKLVLLDAFYSALLQVARINMISTSTMFCRGIDAVFFWTVFVIANIYAIYSIGHRIVRYCRYKRRIGVLGFVIWVTFVVYLLADKLLPLNFSLCDMPVDDMAAVMQRLHIARVVLSTLCAISIVTLYVVSECFNFYNFITQAQLESFLGTLLETLLKENLKDKSVEDPTVQLIVSLVPKLVAHSMAVQQEYDVVNKLNSELETVISVAESMAKLVTDKLSKEPRSNFKAAQSIADLTTIDPEK